MGAAVTDGHSGHKSDPFVAVLTPAAKGLTPMAVNVTPVVTIFDPSPPLSNVTPLAGSDNFGIQRCLLPRQIRTRKADKARKHGTFGTT